MNVRSFSGRHDWHSSVLNDTDADKSTADRIIHNIESSRCPRCEEPLATKIPAGSRITDCRSIPICTSCRSDEAQQCTRRGLSLSPASAWPLDRKELEQRRKERDAKKVRVLAINADGSIVTERGVIRMPRRHDDSAG